ncbi:MAG: DUF2089 domain-containing protein [Rudaea sp.]
MLKLFDKCPACGGQIVITECRCRDCNLQMRGQFQPGLFSALSEDQLTFVRIFLRVRGNLSEVEKVLGISYPTIRNKLDEINGVLDTAEQPAAEPVRAVPAPSTDATGEERRRVLQQVASGEITAAEALERLKNS